MPSHLASLKARFLPYRSWVWSQRLLAPPSSALGADPRKQRQFGGARPQEHPASREERPCLGWRGCLCPLGSQGPGSFPVSTLGLWPAVCGFQFLPCPGLGLLLPARPSPCQPWVSTAYSLPIFSSCCVASLPPGVCHETDTGPGRRVAQAGEGSLGSVSPLVEQRPFRASCSGWVC